MLPIQSPQEGLIQLFQETGVLRFGSFTTKSGRISPYFLNIGNIASGYGIWLLAKEYANMIVSRIPDIDNLYGPAYKGIPLAAVTASVLFHEFSMRNITFTFDRKEAKDHGEGGSLIGYSYQGGEKVVIIEDVLTAGTSVHHSIQLLNNQPNPPRVCALIVAVDRGERGKETTAKKEIEERYQIPVYSLLHISDIVAYIEQRVGQQPEFTEDLLNRIREYQQQYCQ